MPRARLLSIVCFALTPLRLLLGGPFILQSGKLLSEMPVLFGIMHLEDYCNQSLTKPLLEMYHKTSWLLAHCQEKVATFHRALFSICFFADQRGKGFVKVLPQVICRCLTAMPIKDAWTCISTVIIAILH